MNPLVLGLTGLNFALWANALSLLGVAAEPTSEGAPAPVKTVATAGTIMGGSALLFAAIWFIVGKPLGAEATEATALLAGITGMYGFLLTGVFLAQILGFDGRPLGNLCLLVAAFQVIYLVAVARTLGLETTHLKLVEAVLSSYVVLLVLFWALFYGRIKARPVGIWLIVTVIGTTYLQFWAGGVFPPLE